MVPVNGDGPVALEQKLQVLKKCDGAVVIPAFIDTTHMRMILDTLIRNNIRTVIAGQIDSSVEKHDPCLTYVFFDNEKAANAIRDRLSNQDAGKFSGAIYLRPQFSADNDPLRRLSNARVSSIPRDIKVEERPCRPLTSTLDAYCTTAELINQKAFEKKTIIACADDDIAFGVFEALRHIPDTSTILVVAFDRVAAHQIDAASKFDRVFAVQNPETLANEVIARLQSISSGKALSNGTLDFIIDRQSPGDPPPFAAPWRDPPLDH